MAADTPPNHHFGSYVPWARWSLDSSLWIAVQPQDAIASVDDMAVLSLTVASGYSQLSYGWRRDDQSLADGPTIHGSVLSGAATPDLTIANVQQQDAGVYHCVIAHPCGNVVSSTATLTLSAACSSADFNNDGDSATDADIEAFFACLAGDCCAACWHLGADFNGDGDAATDADIESFFRVLAGGAC